MNQKQFVKEIMTVVFGNDYKYMSDEEVSYKLALGMIKQKYEAVSYTHLTLPTNREV